MLDDRPATREETFTPASPVSSNTLNAIQDEIIRLALMDVDTKTIFPRPNLSTNWAAAGDPTTAVAGSIHLASSGAGDAYFCLSDYMHDGQVLDDVRVWIEGDGAVDMTGTVYVQDFDGGTVDVTGPIAAKNVAAGGLTDLDITGITLAAAQATGRIWLKVNANATGARVYAIILIFVPR
jgi:hypothetical protein